MSSRRSTWKVSLVAVAMSAVTATSPQGEEALSVAIEPDGKIVAAGRTNVPFAGSFGGTGYRAAFVVARYLP